VETVWRIETRRESEDPFTNSRIDDAAGVVVRLWDETPDPWPRVHPGPLNATTGFREITAAIEFDLADASGDLQLVLDGRGASGPCPDLRLDVNGERGLVLVQQQRTDRAHDPQPPSPISGPFHRIVNLPLSALRVGRNRISLTTIGLDGAVPEASDYARRPDLGSWFGSTLVWNSIELRRGESEPERATLYALPLFVRSGEGALDELVDIHLTNTSFRGHLRVRGDVDSDVELSSSGYSFGDWRVRSQVRDEPGEVRVVVEAADRHELRAERSRKWTVHLIPHVHLDVGFTDLPAKVLELHSRNLDKAVEIMRQHPEYRFTVDGAILAHEHANARSTEAVAAVNAQIGAGRLALNPLYAQPLTGLMGFEDLCRNLLYGMNRLRDAGASGAVVNITDVPTHTWALPAVLRAAGVPSFLAMADHIRGGNADSDVLHLESPFTWVGADGSEVLTFVSDCYTQLRFVCADPPLPVGIAQGLSALLSRYERPDYIPQDFPLIGTHADNEDLGDSYVGIVERWSEHYEWPRMKMSTPEEYFDSVAAYAAELPRYRGDGGSYWEDGAGTVALQSASVRRSQSALLAAELLVAASNRRLPSDGRIERLDEAWSACVLGSEHTIAADVSTSHPDSEKSGAILEWWTDNTRRAARLAEDSILRSLSELADGIEAKAIPSLLVVNPQGQPRTDVVEVDLPRDRRLVGSDGRRIACAEVGEVGDMKRVRARVELDAFGYELLSVAPGDAPTPTAGDSARYKFEIDPETGSLLSLIDRTTGQQLVADDGEWPFGSVLLATGGGDRHGRGLDPQTSLFDYDPSLPLPQIDVAAVPMELVEQIRRPWGIEIRSRGRLGSLEHVETVVTIPDLSPDVEFKVTLKRAAELAKESVYVAFPFALDTPRLAYDRQLGWVDPQRDHLVGGCHEWLAVYTGVVLQDAERGVRWHTADAPLVAVGDVVRGTWPTSFAPHQMLLSWVMNNYWFTNTPASQEGELTLRYAFAPGADVGEASRAGSELRSPFVHTWVTQNDRTAREARPRSARGRLAEVSADAGIHVSLLAGRKDFPRILRLRDGGDAGGTVRIPVGEDTGVSLVSLLEEEIETVPVFDGEAVVRVPPCGFVTVGLR
jgi:alpha-mannosidase